MVKVCLLTPKSNPNLTPFATWQKPESSRLSQILCCLWMYSACEEIKCCGDQIKGIWYLPEHFHLCFWAPCSLHGIGLPRGHKCEGLLLPLEVTKLKWSRCQLRDADLGSATRQTRILCCKSAPSRQLQCKIASSQTGDEAHRRYFTDTFLIWDPHLAVSQNQFHRYRTDPRPRSAAGM